MSSIAEEIAGLKVASATQTAASQELSQEVAGKMAAIDKKTNDSIANVESTYDQNDAGLTIIATDG